MDAYLHNMQRSIWNVCFLNEMQEAKRWPSASVSDASCCSTANAFYSSPIASSLNSLEKKNKKKTELREGFQNEYILLLSFKDASKCRRNFPTHKFTRCGIACFLKSGWLSRHTIKASRSGRQGPLVKNRASSRLLAMHGDTVKQVTEFCVGRPKPWLNLWPLGGPAVFGFLSNRRTFVLSYE